MIWKHNMQIYSFKCYKNHYTTKKKKKYKKLAEGLQHYKYTIMTLALTIIIYFRVWFLTLS